MIGFLHGWMFSIRSGVWNSITFDRESDGMVCWENGIQVWMLVIYLSIGGCHADHCELLKMGISKPSPGRRWLLVVSEAFQHNFRALYYHYEESYVFHGEKREGHVHMRVKGVLCFFFFYL